MKKIFKYGIFFKSKTIPSSFQEVAKKYKT